MIQMEKEKYLIFLNDINKDKPNEFKKVNMKECPFCNRDELTDIIDQKGPFILLKNKYPTIKDTYQLVLIETYNCDIDMGDYSVEHMQELIRFGVKHWLKIEESGEFKSVIFYKNHGPHSGGSLKHPHMQIVGVKNIDYRLNVTRECLNGDVIWADAGVELNLAREPKIGFMEFNVKAKGDGSVERLADCIQIVTHYLLHHFHRGCNSYNLFFYQFSQEEISVKIVPRFVTSPLFVGYSIPQVSSRAEEVIQEIQNRYFR